MPQNRTFKASTADVAADSGRGRGGRVTNGGDAGLGSEPAAEGSEGRLPREDGSSVVMGRTPLHDAARLSNGHD